MANTPNNDIPLVPENTTDPAAGLNLALDSKIDALLQLLVLGIESAPPGSPADGDRYIVDIGTGDWAGHDDEVARWIDDPGYWDFSSARYALNAADRLLYVNTGDSNGWTVAQRPETLPVVTGDKATDLAAVVGSMLAALNGVWWDDQTT